MRLLPRVSLFAFPAMFIASRALMAFRRFFARYFQASSSVVEDTGRFTSKFPTTWFTRNSRSGNSRLTELTTRLLLSLSPSHLRLSPFRGTQTFLSRNAPRRPVDSGIWFSRVYPVSFPSIFPPGPFPVFIAVELTQSRPRDHPPRSRQRPNRNVDVSAFCLDISFGTLILWSRYRFLLILCKPVSPLCRELLFKTSK